MEAGLVELKETELEEVAGGAGDGSFTIVVQYGYPTYIDTGTSCRPA